MQSSSKISLQNGGCSILEEYETPSGYAGKSINFYDSANDKWHQTWIDNQGAPLYLNGHVKEGSMILSDGANRITWTPLKDGRVRQHWETTNDNGDNWATVFDGYYSPVMSEQRVSE